DGLWHSPGSEDVPSTSDRCLSREDGRQEEVDRYRFWLYRLHSEPNINYSAANEAILDAQCGGHSQFEKAPLERATRPCG
ncbi:hypothetical protein BGZ97_011109, partial [Linnemannia gamsii]